MLRCFYNIFSNYFKNGQSSSWVDINSGVRQGSLFGLLLLLIYSNDLLLQFLNCLVKILLFFSNVFNTKISRIYNMTSNNIDCLICHLCNFSLLQPLKFVYLAMFNKCCFMVHLFISSMFRNGKNGNILNFEVPHVRRCSSTFIC